MAGSTLRVAVASCCSIENRQDQPAWTEIAKADPDVLLLLGDNVYMHNSMEGENEWNHPRLEDNYAKQFAHPQFAPLIEQLREKQRPILVTWDDHDFGINDAKGKEVAESDRARTTALFDRYWHFRAGDRAGPVHCKADIGPVRFIVLDVRSWRPAPGPDANAIGEPQENWLSGLLADSKGPRYTVVASGSTLRIGGPRSERLRGYKAFSERLELNMSRRGRTLFIGGDLHYNAVRQGEGYIELMTSGVAQKVGDDQRDSNNWALLTFLEDSVGVQFHGAGVRRPSGESLEFTIDSDWKITP